MCINPVISFSTCKNFYDQYFVFYIFLWNLWNKYYLFIFFPTLINLNITESKFIIIKTKYLCIWILKHKLLECVCEQTCILLHSGCMRFPEKDLLIVSRDDYSLNLFQENRLAFRAKNILDVRALFAELLYFRSFV